MQERSLTYVGQGIPIRDAILKATGEAVYTADLKLQGMLFGKILYSPVAHARIKSIDTSQAEALPGVRAVVTYKNSPRVPFNSAQRFIEHQIPETEYIFDDTIRFVGDRVAAVAADDLAVAEKALKLIEVEYEEIPAVFDPEEALKPSAPEIHPGGNQVAEIKAEAGEVDQAFAEADHIFEGRYTTPAVHHAALEPHVAIADYDRTGKLTVWSATQNIFAYRCILAKVFDLPMSKVRLIKPTLGGAFGGKLETVLEPVVALLAVKTGRPVKIEMTRRETIPSTRTRHAAVAYLKTGVKKDGTITAQEMKIITNTGAYATSALNVLGAMSGKVFKVYSIPNMRFTGIPVYTNTPIAGAMRGYGSPQAFAVQQMHFNQIAKALGMDMVEFQLKNLVHPQDSEPRFGKPIGNPRPIDCTVKGAEAFAWNDKSTALKNGEGRYRRGIGMAIGSHGNGCFGAHRDVTAMMLKMNEDGTCTLFTGTHEMGNGTTTAYSQIVGEVLGIDPELIACVEADTDTTPWDLGAYASRGLFVGGNAAKKVAENVLDQLLTEASQLLETPKDQLAAGQGFIYDIDNPEKRAGLGEVMVHAQKINQREIIGSETYAAIAGPASYGAHFAEVEVDIETGEVKVLNYAAVHDIGKAINPLSLEGQIEGGIQMGIGYALTEEIKLDEKGKVTNAFLKKYRIPRAKDMPNTKVLLVEEGEEPGPFGAKSIGECATVPASPAVANAVANALDMDFYDLPLSPDRILAALKGGK